MLHVCAPADVLIGGGGNDTFNVGAYLTAGDQIDGGSGNDWLVFNGDYSAGLTFATTTMVNVETVWLGSGHDYDLVLNDGNNTAGLTVNGTSLGAANHLILDGSAETSAGLFAYGGAGEDTLIGGAGIDVLSGGIGRDVFKYQDISGVGEDQITDFALGASGDVLGVHDLLSGFAGYNGSNALSGGYLNFQSSGDNTIVQVDSDGGGNGYATLATLQHVIMTATNTDNYVV